MLLRVAPAAGFGAGAAIAVATVLLEHSRIGSDGYALYGNGALIVPALLAPWTVYWGWTWILRGGGEALEMAVFVLGLHFGVGVTAVLDTLLYPRQPGLTIFDALPGFVLSGALFVLPAALLAGLAYRLFTTSVPLNSFTLFAAGFIAAILVAVYWIGLGILTGMCVAAAKRDMPRRAQIGIALLVLLVVLGNLPYFPGILA